MREGREEKASEGEEERDDHHVQVLIEGTHSPPPEAHSLRYLRQTGQGVHYLWKCSYSKSETTS